MIDLIVSELLLVRCMLSIATNCACNNMIKQQQDQSPTTAVHSSVEAGHTDPVAVSGRKKKSSTVVVGQLNFAVGKAALKPRDACSSSTMNAQLSAPQ